MTTPHEPTPDRRNPLLDKLGPPGPDNAALYDQFARQDRVMLILRYRTDRILDALARVNTETTAIGAELDTFRAQIEATAPAVGGRLGAIATRLRRLAADPDDPVPPG